MKKIGIVLMLLFATVSMSAQGLDFGVKAGVNFSSIRDASGLDNRTGFVAGFFLGGKFNDKIGAQADLLYSQQGAEFELGDFNLDYINIPVVLKYYLTENFNLQVGPQFGVIINEDVNIVSETIEDISTNNFDLSAVIGIGVDIPFGLRLEGRYNFGLTDTNDQKQLNGDTLVDSGKNSVVTLSVGYSFL